MITSPVEPELAGLKPVRPLEAEIPRSPGVYSWWLDTAVSPTPEAAGLALPFGVPRPQGPLGAPQLLYVGRTKSGLRRRITDQHLKRTRSSTLRRTLLAMLMPTCGKWIEGTCIDSGGRPCLDKAAEDHLTRWIGKNLLIGWVPLENASEVVALEAAWIETHQPPLNAKGTHHGHHVAQCRQDFILAVGSRTASSETTKNGVD